MAGTTPELLGASIAQNVPENPYLMVLALTKSSKSSKVQPPDSLRLKMSHMSTPLNGVTEHPGSAHPL